MANGHTLSFTMLGTGAVGGFYGSRLLLGGARVRFIARSDVDWIRTQGLRVESPLGDQWHHPVEVYGPGEPVPASEVVCIALKTTENDRLPELLRPLLGEGTVILNLQNGLGLEDELAGLFPQAIILAGLCFLCAHKLGPGHIRHLDYGRISLAPWDNRGQAQIPRLQAAFAAGGIDTEVQESLLAARWRKLAWNIPFNGLSVLLDCNTQGMMSDPEARTLVERLMQEVGRGAAACGVPFAPGFIHQLLEATARMVPYDPSMRLDFLAHRPLELEYLYHRPLREAAKRGVQMPGVQTLTDLLAIRDRANRCGSG